MRLPRGPIIALLLRVLERVRFPYLLALTATLFVLDLFLPDPIPLIDEILLGLLTLLLASWQRPGPYPRP